MPKPRVDWQGDPLPDGAVARMVSSRLRHPGSVRTLAFSADGRSIVSGGNDLRLWDAATGKLRHRLDFGKTINGVSFRCTAKDIVCAVPDDKGIVAIRVVDPATGKERRSRRIDEEAQGINPTLSPDGKRLAVAHKNAVQLYDTTTGAKIVRIPIKGVAAWDIAFAPDGKTVAFNDLSTDTIYLHDATNGKLVRELKHPETRRCTLFFHPMAAFSLPCRRAGSRRKAR